MFCFYNFFGFLFLFYFFFFFFLTRVLSEVENHSHYGAKLCNSFFETVKLCNSIVMKRFKAQRGERVTAFSVLHGNELLHFLFCTVKRLTQMFTVLQHIYFVVAIVFGLHRHHGSFFFLPGHCSVLYIQIADISFCPIFCFAE
jgi:hypothetical protein